MRVVILCGGKGTRAYPHTQEIPKALMNVDGQPIVEQVMQIYGAQGYRDFVLSCGYLMHAIVDHFDRQHPIWDVECADTGEEADTGDRIWRLQDRLGPTFHATYCDGLGDIDLQALLDFHHSHGGLATVTAVPLRSQYGILQPDGDAKVVGFDEKPILQDYWINGGFFVFNQQVFDHWEGHNLEQDVLPKLARMGELRMYRHHGYWRSMDTYKDQQILDREWPPLAARFHPKELGGIS